ncbi:MAG: TonB-dependent receptor [Acidobacteriota bacterium]
MDKRLASTLFATIGFCALPALALAQAPPALRITQEVVVTASVAPVVTTDVARDVNIITRSDLDLLGLKSIIDALRLVPGVDARARGPLDVQTDFSIRGATFGQNLILVDGIRLNDSQTGHHNGEIPLPAIAVDRIEIVEGAGSAVHGADALGGTINVISRHGSYAAGSLTYGQHHAVDTQASIGGGRLPVGWTLSGWGGRSDGFMFDREFAFGGAAVRGTPARGVTIDLRHQRRAFGANGFYGNSPSKEWTDGTIGGAQYLHAGAAWTTVVQGSMRNHGDHFRWDIARPGFAENRHRTNAGDLQARVERRLGASTVTIGASGGGDWVHSSNLGDHHEQRGGAFAEWQAPLSARATLVAGLRFDDYSTFGRSSSPSVSVVAHATRDLRLRASAGHAFRVPTYTERFYTDPSNQGTPDLGAERGWSVDGGADWTRAGWTSSLSVFTRWDNDVIDWLRATTADVWRSGNVRDVTTRGLEASVSHRTGPAYVRAYYTGLSVDAPSVGLLSKYVLEYARHQAGGSVSLPVGAGARIALNADFRNRLVAQTWHSYTLLSARVSRAFKRTDVYLDGSNLLNANYQEIAGVAMPGRWMSVGVTVR